MQVYVARVTGTPTAGDCVRITWMGSNGGRIDAGHHVRENDTMQDVLQMVATSAKNYFLTDQEVQVRDGSLMIITSRDDGWITGDVEGACTEAITIEKL